ncbi:efflux RND transporter periplasmic adaptor subunit [Gloeocapsa sp. PCC 73106]|uniref:efflux RND transporter periplasmic adaptor subunit n=1 Tax=Gloeocapsa sp. PCC 73106 TaxID=102232 RepID=UPI0002AC3E11|nr:efflux RND transporter periplasmic adaptor subunit [Gloeocapsa sp. PCC 73106]ELR98943.1 RND family efflux transporter, MFP subunit [Gloeocapsa sp. PCC 73106]
MLKRYTSVLLLSPLSAAIVSICLLSAPSGVLAHGGHGDEFQGETTTNSVSVDAQTADRLGITVEPVTRKYLDVGLKTTGQIETLPGKQVEVTTPVEGAKIVELLVVPGDKVESGQPVAILSSPELVELRVSSEEKRAEAEADLQQAQADLAQAQQNYQKFTDIASAEIAQAQSELSFAQEKYEKDNQLSESGALPRRDALESQTEYKEAQTNLARALSRRDVIDAEAQLKRAQAAVEVAKSRLQLSDSVYQTRLAQLGTSSNNEGLVTVTAPITGRVADREVTLGQSFQDSGSKLMTIVDDSSVYAIANIYEKDLDKVKTGQQVRLTVASGGDRTFTGSITALGAMVEGETRIVPVRAQIDNSEGVLKPGMFAELEVLTDQTATTILVIPNSALVEANGKQLVYLQNGNAFQGIEVTVGQTSGDLVEIKKGLFEGDKIVTQRALQLYAQSLRTVPEPEKPEAILQEMGLPIPGWLLGVGGGLLIGVLAGRRRTHPTEVYTNNQTDRLLEKQEDSNKPN